jgi:hypothetical protein
MRKYKRQGPSLGEDQGIHYIQDLKKSYELMIQMVLYQDKAIRDIQAGAMDWFSLPPTLRTKEMMRRMVGLK